MRRAGDFNPEWGYFAPAPSFVRSLRTAVVVAAIGIVAGAAVVVSLADRPVAEGSAAPPTLAQPVAPVTPISTPETLPAKMNVKAANGVASEPTKAATDQHAGSAATLAELPAIMVSPPDSAPMQLPVQAVPVQAVPVQAVPVQAVPVQAVPVPVVNEAASTPDGSPAQKKPVKKSHSSPRNDQVWKGPLALLRSIGVH